eukprot:5127160-Pleurochrysis_carterae.AAC.1
MSSHGWKGWSGSDDFPMRCAGEAPMFCVSQFAGAGMARNGGEFAKAVESTSCTVPASASGARMQKARPSASVVKAMSPPPWAKRALSATSESTDDS